METFVFFSFYAQQEPLLKCSCGNGPISRLPAEVATGRGRQTCNYALLNVTDMESSDHRADGQTMRLTGWDPLRRQARAAENGSALLFEGLVGKCWSCNMQMRGWGETIPD